MKLRINEPPPTFQLQLSFSQISVTVILGLGFPSSRRFSPATPRQSKLDSARSQDSSSSSTRFVTAQRLAALIMHILYPEKRTRPLTHSYALGCIVNVFLHPSTIHLPDEIPHENLSSLNAFDTRANVCHPTNCSSVFDKRFLSPSASRRSCASHAR